MDQNEDSQNVAKVGDCCQQIKNETESQQTQTKKGLIGNC
jgi:hypothetical protein